MPDYSVLFKVLLDRFSFQQQVKELSNSTAVTVKAQLLGGDRLQTQLGTFKNQLEGIKIRNADAFKNADIDKMYKSTLNLVEGFGKGTVSAGEVKVAIGQLRNSVASVNESFRTTTKSADNFGTVIKKDIAKVAEWLVATTLIVGALRQIGEGIQYIEDLNKAMTNIGLVTGQTADEMQGLAKQYNEMAMEMGTDTLSMAEGATEWINY